MQFDLDNIKITDVWLINKETGEKILHLNQSAKFDPFRTAAGEVRVKYVQDKEGNFSLVSVMSQEGKSRIDKNKQEKGFGEPDIYHTI